VELSKEFNRLVSKLIVQKQDELSREQSQRRDKILNDSARNGWNIPPGYVYQEFDDIQVDSIRRRGDIVWSSLEQTLEAFDPSFYPELATQLHSLVESFFPLRLSEPHGYLRQIEWKHPMEEKINQRLRSRLEGARVSSLSAVRTNIDLYVAKKRSKFKGGESSPLNSEDKEDFVSPLVIGLSQKSGDAVIDQTVCHRSLFIDYTKTVLSQHPGATTADLRRNCFENIEGLNSRDSKIINDLLVEAGAKKSKKGEHAKDFVWESKYPRAQWERVFSKKK
jgi:hypothetical protein